MWVLVGYALCVHTAVFSIPEETQQENMYLSDMTNEEVNILLLSLAVEKGYLPEDPTDFDLDEAYDNENMVGVWASTLKDDKIAMVDIIKEIFQKKGLILKYSSDYYVREVDVFYCAVLLGDSLSPERDAKTPAIVLVKVIAMMDGDVDVGHDVVLEDEFAEAYAGSYDKGDFNADSQTPDSPYGDWKK